MNTAYRRTKDGLRVHLSACRHAKNAVPWIWAENFPKWQIVAAMLAYGSMECKVCRPFEGKTL